MQTLSTNWVVAMATLRIFCRKKSLQITFPFTNYAVRWKSIKPATIFVLQCL